MREVMREERREGERRGGAPSVVAHSSITRRVMSRLAERLTLYGMARASAAAGAPAPYGVQANGLALARASVWCCCGGALYIWHAAS